MQGASSDASRTDGAGDRTRAVGGDRSRSASGPRRVGVLSPHDSKETKAILNAVRALWDESVWIRDENPSSRIEDGSLSVSPRVDVLVNRLLLTESDQLLEDLQAAALYAETVPVVNPPEAVWVGGDWRTDVALGGDVEGVIEDLGPESRRIAVETADVLEAHTLDAGRTVEE